MFEYFQSKRRCRRCAEKIAVLNTVAWSNKAEPGLLPSWTIANWQFPISPLFAPVRAKLPRSPFPASLLVGDQPPSMRERAHLREFLSSLHNCPAGSAPVIVDRSLIGSFRSPSNRPPCPLF